MGAADGIGVLLALLDHAARWGAVVQQARAENRRITATEIDGFFTADDVADLKLKDAIAKAKAEGR